MAAEEDQSRASLVLISGCGLILSGIFWWVAEQDAFRWDSLGKSAPSGPLLFGLVAVAVCCAPWLRARARRTLVLGASLCAGAVVARWLIFVPVLFAFAVVYVARKQWPVWLRLVLVLGLWAAAPMTKWIMPREQALSLAPLFFYWVGLPFAAVYLVVERSRGKLAGVQARDEWTYLLALPRFVVPFAQPIGAADFFTSFRERLTPRLALGALSLGIWGAALQMALQFLHYNLKPAAEPLNLLGHGPRVLENLVMIYGVNAGKIFCAVALLRLLGFELGSGFRWPLLSRSFAEGFRRWNYYYYKLIVSIFYYPMVFRLRRQVPLWLAHVLAGYVSIFLGAWSINFVLAPLAISSSPELAFRHLQSWQGLVPYLILWSLIIVPEALLLRFRRIARPWWWRLSAHIMTLSLMLVLLTWAFYYRVYLV